MKKKRFKHSLIECFTSLNRLSFLRDIIIFIVVISAVVAYQTRNMLNTNGDIIIAQRNLVSLDGEVIPLLSNVKPNLVYFFAPWCSVCDLSIDNLSYLDSEKINVVVIALDYTSTEEVTAFIEKNEVSAKVLMGNDNLKQEFAIVGYPSYYLIGTDHSVQSKSYGYSTAIGLKLRELFGS